MHEHKTIMTMNGEYCPTCGQFLKDIKVKPTENPPEKVKKSVQRKHRSKGAFLIQIRPCG